MMLKSFFLTAVFAVQALTAPIEPTRDYDAEDWRLLDLSRACSGDGGACDYRFQIAEHANNTEKPPRHCEFTVYSTQGLPATEVFWSLAKCPDAPAYSVNGGWSPQGFVTLTVLNDETDRMGFFGYEDKELAGAAVVPARQSFVYFNQVPAKRNDDPLANADSWTVDSVMRYVTYPATPDETVVVSFAIDTEAEPKPACFVKWLVNGPGRPSAKSFFGQNCGQYAQGFDVSWGHNETSDEAVMTLVNNGYQKRAYFGFNNVSTIVVQGRRGPSPVEALPQQIGPFAL
ncbi:hypothetical protein C8035_v000026 [Colletotrichum spinosum]|nr:hypothetical protein C8035_v000026 [Colletotrichum spinosum]